MQIKLVALLGHCLSPKLTSHLSNSPSALMNVSVMAMAVKERCVNPVCTPGKPCPEFRCPVSPIVPITPTPTPTITLLPGPTGCVNPVCTPGKACPEYVCASKLFQPVYHRFKF